jgi:hypothetical protein
MEVLSPTIIQAASLRRCLAALLGLFLFVSSMAAQPAISPEYKIKAVFLFNFAQFVEWPKEAFHHPDAPLVIGVLGPDPFGSFLDETVHGERVGGRRLEVRRYANVQQVVDCHILFISQSEASKLKAIRQQLTGRPVLTVGESEGFATSGGMIRFMMEQNRIRLRINLEAVQASRLTISSKLLRAAEIVGTQKE